MRTLQDEIKRHNLLRRNTNTEKRYLKSENCNKNPQKRNENLSKRDIEELMGIRRPRYTKQKGVIKQK
ncbi:hypothetical protein ACFSY7_03125 [Kurthia populi]|uniref:Uncharacterized protein n=1 Tax=Kurthia populi TaxID=1562132 RepID=A0ABW5XWY5_9BACL